MAASWFRILPAAAAVVAPAPAAATIYLSIPAAQQALFPGAQFVEHPLALTDQKRKAIARDALVAPRHGRRTAAAGHLADAAGEHLSPCAVVVHCWVRSSRSTARRPMPSIRRSRRSNACTG